MIKATWGDKPKNKFKVIEERELESLLDVDWFAWNDVPGNDNHKFVTHLDYLFHSHLANGKYEIRKGKGKERNIIKFYFDNSPPIRMELKDSMSAELTYDGITIEFFVKYIQNQFYISKYQLTTLDGIKSIYSNLRENYEYRLRYDEAGEFFIREMELKRIYRDTISRLTVRNSFESKEEERSSSLKILRQIKKNWWLRRNISLTGFYRLASYGEKLRMPAIFGLTVPIYFDVVLAIKSSIS